MHFLKKRGRGFNAWSAFHFNSIFYQVGIDIIETLFVRHRVCAFTTEYLDLLGCNYTSEFFASSVQCTSTWLYIPVMYFCCRFSVCFYTDVAAAAVLLIAAAICHRVCRMLKCVAVVRSIGIFFLVIQTLFRFYKFSVPVGSTSASI